MTRSLWYVSRARWLNAISKQSPVRRFCVSSTMTNPDYSNWNADQLIAKVQALEKDLKAANEKYRASVVLPSKSIRSGSSENSTTPRKSGKEFDPSRYSTRMIALKFAYLGQNYNGLEYTAGNITSQPTIEEVVWAALMKGKLIFPTDQEAIAAGQTTWEGCDYTKCGRTDKGVSAFGQVIGLRVRSNRPLPGRRKQSVPAEGQRDGEPTPTASEGVVEEEKPFDPVQDEIPYVQILNHLLPPDIRALAWCSDLPNDFSARFSCRERRYRYFFTNPAFTPTFASTGLSASRTKNEDGSPRREGWLDIKAMQDAARRYEGLHDFRNLCKIDASKQLTDFRRRIYHSEIRQLNPAEEPAAYVSAQAFSELSTTTATNGTHSQLTSTPKVYQFVLHGSAFLWHQVRHMVAILFLVGQGLESPDIVDKLLDVQDCPRKPHYEMADDAPLVLWDCIFPDLDSSSRDDALPWIYAGDQPGPGGRPGKDKFGTSGLVDNLWEVWRKRKIDEVLAGSLLNLAAGQGKNIDSGGSSNQQKPKVYLGGDNASHKGVYTPVLQRAKGEHFEVVNERYAKKKGYVQKTKEELDHLRETRRDKRHDHLNEPVG